jgi:hypothetical protein
MEAIFWCLLTQDSHIWQLGCLADAYTGYLMTETRWLSVPPSRMVYFFRLWIYFHALYSTCQEKCAERENEFLRLSSGILHFPGKPAVNE